MEELASSFGDFKKLVDAVILLMKQSVDPAMEILTGL
jgi:hypothetical protein